VPRRPTIGDHVPAAPPPGGRPAPTRVCEVCGQGMAPGTRHVVIGSYGRRTPQCKIVPVRYERWGT